MNIGEKELSNYFIFKLFLLLNEEDDFVWFDDTDIFVGHISDGDNYVTDFVYRILKKYPHTRRLLSYVLAKPYDDLCDEECDREVIEIIARKKSLRPNDLGSDFDLDERFKRFIKLVSIPIILDYIFKRKRKFYLDKRYQEVLEKFPKTLVENRKIKWGTTKDFGILRFYFS